MRTRVKAMPLRGWRLPARHKVPAQAFYMCGVYARFQIHFLLNQTQGVTHVSMGLSSNGDGSACGWLAKNVSACETVTRNLRKTIARTGLFCGQECVVTKI